MTREQILEAARLLSERESVMYMYSRLAAVETPKIDIAIKGPIVCAVSCRHLREFLQQRIERMNRTLTEMGVEL